MKNKKKILITGGSGYIGSCLANFFSKKFKVYTLDKVNKNFFLNSNIKHIKCNLNFYNKTDKAINAIKPHAIIHLAAQSTIDKIDKLRKNYFRDNVSSTKVLLKVVKKHNIKKFIFASTAAVYKSSDRSLSENSQLKSNNSYGKNKLKCEKLIKKILNKSNCKYCILRFFNVSSSLRSFKIGEFHNPETHLIPIIINSIINSKKLNIYGNDYKTKDGTCIRDYIHIYDILRAIDKAIIYLNKKKSDIFNLGSGRSYTVLEIINKCSDILKKNAKINIRKRRKYDVSKLACKISKAKNKLGWYPKKSKLDDIIKDEIWWNKYLRKCKKYRNFIY